MPSFSLRMLLHLATSLLVGLVAFAGSCNNAGQAGSQISIPAGSKDAALLGTTLASFDGEYPPGWPQGINVPNGAFLNNNGSIKDRNADASSNITSGFRATGAIKGSVQDIFAMITNSGSYSWQSSPAESGGSMSAAAQLSGSEYTTAFVRVDELDSKSGWVWFIIGVS